jgi:hypothetical protein
VVPAVVTLFGALASLIGRSRKRAILANDFTEHAKALASAVGHASSITRELEAFLDPLSKPGDYRSAALECVAKAEGLLSQVNAALLDLGLKPIHG